VDLKFEVLFLIRKLFLTVAFPTAPLRGGTEKETSKKVCYCPSAISGILVLFLSLFLKRWGFDHW
jgi:hypothetical protein